MRRIVKEPRYKGLKDLLLRVGDNDTSGYSYAVDNTNLQKLSVPPDSSPATSLIYQGADHDKSIKANNLLFFTFVLKLYRCQKRVNECTTQT